MSCQGITIGNTTPGAGPRTPTELMEYRRMPSLADLYTSSPSSFQEVQRPRQWWVWTLGLGVAALAWANFLYQIVGGQPLGADPAPDWFVWVFWALFGL